MNSLFALAAIVLTAPQPPESQEIVRAMANGSRPAADRAIEQARLLGAPPALLKLIARMLGPENEEPARQNAAYVLSILAPVGQAEALVGALQDQSPIVRQHACTGLGKLKWKKAAEALLLRTKDESPVVRREAIRALGRMRAKQALTVAIDMLKDPSPEPQLAAMIALGELGDAKGLAPLRRFLSDSSEQVRLASARGLCMLGDRQAKALAFKMLASVEPNQRLDGLWIMDAVQAPWARKELAKRLADADFSVRVAAASALVRQGDGRGVEALIVAAQDAPPAEHERLEQAIVDLPITPADRKKILEGARRK